MWENVLGCGGGVRRDVGCVEKCGRLHGVRCRKCVGVWGEVKEDVGKCAGVR